ncbi:coiled-coil domain-containing protein [Carpediemonas membranifera]|uniref:Coiled-coil domain-containing protein n=1 Tax=Carpediemonas membranifera TaxID=201153 RepID=A0A8J6AWN2_9EUKA|nr:coiled-coil domain-containing protein [Carpediemonas membranifera]|eukprot:KAG9390168.1 coiled-coil domain-containing protein [Carpediemonas membranifera]
MQAAAAGILLYADDTEQTAPRFQISGPTVAVGDQPPVSFDNVIANDNSSEDYNQSEEAYVELIGPCVDKLLRGVSSTVLVSSPESFAHGHILTAYPPPNSSGLMNFISDGLFAALKNHISTDSGEHKVRVKVTMAELFRDKIRDLCQPNVAESAVEMTFGASGMIFTPELISTRVEKSSKLIQLVKTALSRKTEDKPVHVVIRADLSLGLGPALVSPSLTVVVLAPTDGLTKDPTDTTRGLHMLKSYLADMAVGKVSFVEHPLLSLIPEALHGTTRIAHIAMVPAHATPAALATLELASIIRKVRSNPMVHDDLHRALMTRYTTLMAVERARAGMSTNLSVIKEANEAQKVSLDRLREEKRTQNDRIEALNGANKALVEQKKELQERLVGSEKARVQVSRKLLELRLAGTKMVEAAEKEKFNAQNQLLAVQRDTVELQKKYEEITVSGAAANDKLAAVVRQRDDLETELKRVRGEADRTAKELGEAKEQIDLLSLEVINGEKSRLASEKAMKEAQAEVQAEKAAVADLAVRMKTLSADHRAVTDEVLDLRRQLVEQQGEGDAAAVHARMMAERKDLELQLKNAVAALGAKEREVTRAAVAAEASKAEFQVRMDAIDRLEQEYRSQIDHNAGHVDDMAEALTKAVSAIHRNETDRIAVAADHISADIYAQVKESAAGQVRAMDIRLTSLESALSISQAQRDGLAASLQQAVDVIESAGLGNALAEKPSHMLEQFKAEMKKTEGDQRIVTLKQQLAELEAQNKGLNGRMATLADKSQRAYLELEERYSSAVAELKALRTSFKDNNAGAEPLREENWRLRRELEDLRMRAKGEPRAAAQQEERAHERARLTRPVPANVLAELEAELSSWKVRAVMAEEQLAVMTTRLQSQGRAVLGAVNAISSVRRASEASPVASRSGSASSLPSQSIHSAGSRPPRSVRTPVRTARSLSSRELRLDELEMRMSMPPTGRSESSVASSQSYQTAYSGLSGLAALYG